MNQLTVVSILSCLLLLGVQLARVKSYFILHAIAFVPPLFSSLLIQNSSVDDRLNYILHCNSIASSNSFLDSLLAWNFSPLYNLVTFFYCHILRVNPDFYPQYLIFLQTTIYLFFVFLCRPHYFVSIIYLSLQYPVNVYSTLRLGLSVSLIYLLLGFFWIRSDKPHHSVPVVVSITALMFHWQNFILLLIKPIGESLNGLVRLKFRLNMRKPSSLSLSFVFCLFTFYFWYLFTSKLSDRLSSVDSSISYKALTMIVFVFILIWRLSPDLIIHY